MSGESKSPITPVAKTQRSRRIPLVWIVPLITLAIGAWLAWDTYSKRGPTITITFDSGDGLQAGQSQLKYKDVVMGTVKSVTISPDLTKVVATVETTRDAERLINDKTVFWIVKPQLFAGRVSGLDTLLSGSYIGMLPSSEPGQHRHHFIGNTDPPVLPAYVPGAFVAIEDRRFYSHMGVDPKAIVRALGKNAQSGGVSEGGSTITQQLAKNAFLSSDRNLRRKAQEAMIAVYLEARLSKDEILSRYLSSVYFGDGAFGLRAAARHYFGVSAAALSPEQAARLAAMVPNPRFYDRNRNAPGLGRKTAIILGRMPSAELP